MKIENLVGRYFKIEGFSFDETYVYVKEVKKAYNKSIEINRNLSNDSFELYNNDLYASLLFDIEDKDEITKEEFMKVYNVAINKLNEILK